jgi:hypothetical protein
MVGAMGRKSRKDIAIEAAIAYYGFSSAAKSFPKGVQVEVLEGGSPGEMRGNAAKVGQEVDKHWNESVGGLSRTSRISGEDMKYIAKKIGLTPNDKLVEEWMVEITNTHPQVCLVKLTYNKARKLLLVNTDVTQ